MEMHKPLEGIRILEWGIFHAGPGGPAILADMGAEVIKIEQPGLGDPMRLHKRYKDIDFTFGKDRNLFYEGANRGKKSVTIDLADAEGRDIAYSLVKKSDVFFTNLRLSTVKSMNMDYPTLSNIKPDLIYASVTSYGRRGADADRGGFDYQGQARSGLMYNLGEPGMPPLLAQFGIIDQATAIMASYQMIIGLWMRERFGIGQEIDVSLLGTASYLMYINNLTALVTGREVPRHEQASADPLRNYYECKDGKWIVHNQVHIPDRWQAVCELLGLPELAQDPRYDTQQKRLINSADLVRIFNKAFSTKPCDEWVRLFAEKGLIASPANTTMEAVKDPQMIENEYVVDFDHPEIGNIKIPGFPIRFSKAEIQNNLLGPGLGEHTESVLKEIGGYTDEEIVQFRKKKII
jgi:crotonobetainyl-CoA:carnitine CoA-transferase CaiB-like acyl-CoA transferase